MNSLLTLASLRVLTSRTVPSIKVTLLKWRRKNACSLSDGLVLLRSCSHNDIQPYRLSSTLTRWLYCVEYPQCSIRSKRSAICATVEFSYNVFFKLNDLQIRYDTIRCTILTCAQKLANNQLNLPHGKWKLHCVSKNVTPLTCYNLHIHGSIATIFGRNVAEKAGNQNVLYFRTSPK